MNRWSDLWQAELGKTALVIGNGPSRKEQAQRAADFGADVVIACNAYWREPAPWPRADYLVCYDGTQSQAALTGYLGPIIIPEQRDEPVHVDVPECDEERVFVAAPHLGTGMAEHALIEGWSPTDLALGNLSGLLAYQLALILGCKHVVLLGMDCGGILTGDGVGLSAIDDKVAGYGYSPVPAAHCEAIGLAHMPKGWQHYRSLWRALTRKGDEFGTRTDRATMAGSLDWLEVNLEWGP